jgi:DNA-directed RNA polymerase specialized sigma24 family protein
MRVAKDACFAYVNIKSLPVTVPNHSTTRAILNGNVKAIADSDMDEDSIRWLALVLGASAAPLDNFVDVLETNEDLTDAIAVDEIWDVASNVLEPEHFDIFYRYYHEGEGQSSIAESLGVSQAAVSQMLSKSASEIKKGL